MSKGIKVINVNDGELRELKGGLRSRRIITKKSVGSEKLMVGIATCDPGKGHDWHCHVDGQEEVLYIVEGEVTVTWIEDGLEKKLVAKKGDCIFSPSGVENKIVNTGNTQLIMVACIVPPPE